MMKNKMFLLLIPGSIVCASFLGGNKINEPISFALDTEIPSVFEENLLEEEGGVFRIFLRHSPEEKTIESIYTIDFLDREEFSSKLEEIELVLLEELSLSGAPYAFSGVLTGSKSTKTLLPLLEKDLQKFFSSSLYSMEGHKELPFFKGEVLYSVNNVFYFPSMNGWGDGVSQGGEAKTPRAEPFFNLRLTNEDKRNTRTLISTMSDHNLIQLFLEQKGMEKIGDKLLKVHPLRFIGYILADSYLRRCLKTIEKDSIKWSHFIEGYNEAMKKEAKAGNIDVYIPGFAELLDVKESEVASFIKDKDYVGLVQLFLIE